MNVLKSAVIALLVSILLPMSAYGEDPTIGVNVGWDSNAFDLYKLVFIGLDEGKFQGFELGVGGFALKGVGEDAVEEVCGGTWMDCDSDVFVYEAAYFHSIEDGPAYLGVGYTHLTVSSKVEFASFEWNMGTLDLFVGGMKVDRGSVQFDLRLGYRYTLSSDVEFDSTTSSIVPWAESSLESSPAPVEGVYLAVSLGYVF